MAAENSARSPYECEDLDPMLSEEVAGLFDGTLKEFIRVGPKGYFASKDYAKLAPNIYNMALRPTDIFVATYQRSGTTLTQELVWLVVNDFDYETAKSQLLTQRFPFIDFPMFLGEKTMQLLQKIIGDPEKFKQLLKICERSPLDILAESPDPRFIKTHVPLSLLPPRLLDTSKVVYVARDPRDVAVSSYHQAKLFVYLNVTGDFKQFWNLFIRDLYWFCPYFDHVKEAWAQRNHPNMLFLFYEDIIKDLPTNIRRIAKFFGKTATEDQVRVLCDHLHIDNFKKNPAVNFEEARSFGMLTSKEKFIRTGKSGGWRNYFDEEMTKQAESWIAGNLRDTDLRFPSMPE